MSKRLFASLPVWAPLLGAHPDAIRPLLSYLAQVVEDLSAGTLIDTIVLHSPKSKEAIMTVAEQLIQQGHVRGREEGREEGRREALRQLLTLKFGTVAPTVTARVATAKGRDLEQWTLRVLTALSAEDVVA